MEFAWGRDLEIYTKEGEEGLFYTRGYIRIAAHNDLWLYGEIRHNEGEWEEKLSYMEWDTRFGLERDNNVEEGHGIYTGFEEDGNDLFKGTGGIMELTREKEQVDADTLIGYLDGQKKMERDAESIGTILYFEEQDEFVWWNTVRLNSRKSIMSR